MKLPSRLGSGAGLVGRSACGWGSGMPAPSGQIPTAAVPALAAQSKTGVDQRAERYQSELQAAFQAANPNGRITSGIT
jgi:hypothetical protein